MKCAVITPVGPGHEALFEQVCAPSVAQARAFDMGPFAEVHHFMMDDTAGRYGRSARRNEALQRAMAEGIDWVFFLDADDVLTPNAFEAFGRVIAAEPELDVVWGLICTLEPTGEPELREGQPATLDSRAEYLAVAPYNAVQIGGFYRTGLAARIGFDTALDTGEDYKFYCRLWAEARCAKRPEIFFLNKRGMHSTGPRSATGADWSRAVALQWRAQLAQVPVWAEFDDGQGTPVRMRLTDPADAIQHSFVEGHFYGAESLAKLKKLVKAERPRIAEVGGNVGNHLVWYARNLAPEKIYLLEPKPVQSEAQLLAENITANGLDTLVERLRPAPAEAPAPAPMPMISTGLMTAPARRSEAPALDDLLTKERIDIVRIDAKGMELDVLAGAADLIARDRPVIWIEVQRQNIIGFAQGWCRKAGYRIADSTFAASSTEYFAIPKESS
ncbi:FkbM family methyltransferase [Salipiger sp. PrR002]|uniref:FkbM family methyltransferase n=1 Tax=Salipiger sp. PrR002 TaxID=2706489 RepID=UPI0013B90567|nr:FkbM family methyltransferase [Salipiger sp. PrR002]NDW00952.1 FkbM family methyltransferase [Salipiger sp. PrR002]NDW56499.1 FkbM family methyltransferase [Salipiger sp. PrR004]